MTDMAVRRGTGMVGVVAAVGFAVAGCGSEQGAATPQPSQVSVAASPTSVDAEAKVWDPCSLPDSAVGGVGLNVGSKKKDVAGVDFSGWKVCSWSDSAKQYTFSVMSSEHPIADSRARTDFTDFVPMTVGSHNALQLRTTGSTHDSGCSIVVEVPDGSVMFRVLNRVSASAPPSPCPEVGRLADSLVQYIPAN
ncbi:DUF3558 domain-containing protein [Nocardia rosealba]|nr:DUF3558 domain-containing protein [Nocardia rosealba]